MGGARPDGDAPIASRRAGPRHGASGSGIGERRIRRSRRPASVPPISPRRTSTPPARPIAPHFDAKPGLFEACYGLAVLELDAGDAAAA